MPWIPLFFAGAAAVRVVTLIISIRHERALKRDGAVEVGAGNSKALALAHTAFYFSALAEGLYRRPHFDAVSITGIAIYAFGMISLAVVISLLGKLWTVKLLIARNHTLVTHPLFRAIRHPNYFLNLIPELVGFALTMHAFVTLILGLSVYMVPLVTRIRQEEAAMSERFANYKV